MNVVMVQVENYMGRGRQYAERLRDNIREHLTVPHTLYAISELQYQGIHQIMPQEGVKGWWQKLVIFRPGLFTQRTLFLDLDTIIVDNINFLADYDGHFAIPHDFWRPQGLGPAVMLFDPKWAEFIYQEWQAHGFPQTDPRGDQGWLEGLNQGRMRKEVDIMQELFPGAFYSYKTSCIEAVPEGAKVICLHGKPRLHETKGWAKDYWEETCLQS